MLNTPRSIVSEFFLVENVREASVQPYKNIPPNIRPFQYGAWNIGYDKVKNIIYASDTRKNANGPYVKER